MTYAVSFNCYKVSLEPNLQRVAEFFKIPFSSIDPGALVLKPEQVAAVLKLETPTKFVWFFKFGCICFINFESAETYRFLKNIESIYGLIDFDLFSNYNEDYYLTDDDPEGLGVSLDLLELYAIILAKSTELKYHQETLDLIYDRAERLLFDLQRGLPKPTSRVIKKMTFDIVKIQLTLINTLKVLERPKGFDDLQLQNIYHSANQLFELPKRFETIQTKINTILEIISPYQKLGFNQRETRLLFFEVLLLLLFPLSRILDYFFPKILTFLHFL